MRTKPPLLFATRLLLCCSIVFLSATIADAVSVSEYQSNLKQAITALDTLSNTDEDETESDYARRFNETLTTVRKVLPESQMVECGEELCSVDNSWLHDQLKELEKASDSKWFVLLTHIIEQLKAIDERVTELRTGNAKDGTKPAAKERLGRILARPEYATKSPASSALARILEAIARWLARLLGRQSPIEPSGNRVITLIVQAVIFVLALGVLAYVIKLLLPKLSRRRGKAKKAKAEPRIVLGERLEPEASAVDLLAEAEALARSGQIRAAIRKAYIALLVELGDRKIISLAHHKTNRDYLRAVRSIPNLYPVMAGLTDSFERHWYGLSQAEAHDWESFQDGYKTVLQGRT
jgi:Domain of unknown function (DUF4129)